MIEATLPEDVKQFLADYIDSVERLEVLLLLHRKPRPWSPKEVSGERRSSEIGATVELSWLVERGLIVVEADRYRVHGDPAMAQILDRVAAVYRERPVGVITFIYTKPGTESHQRPPADPLRSFVDAFRIKGEKGDG